MSDREFDEYLAIVGGLLRLAPAQRAALAGELRDHFLEAVAVHLARNVPRDEAVRLALMELGDAAALAAGFAPLIRNRRRRIVMKCALASLCVVGALFAGSLLLRPDLPGRPADAVAQDVGADADQDPAVAVEVQADPPIVEVDTDDTVAAVEAAVEEVLVDEAIPVIVEVKAGDPFVTVGELQSDKDRLAREALATEIDAEFADVPLREAVNYVGQVLDLQTYLDMQGIADEGVDGETPVALNLRQIPGEMVLDLILSPYNLAYTIRSGVVIVTKRDKAEEIEVRVYRVDAVDLIELSELVTTMIAPESWDEIGGRGNIRAYHGALVVAQSPRVHDGIAKFLEDLKAALPEGAALTGKTKPVDGDRIEIKSAKKRPLTKGDEDPFGAPTKEPLPVDGGGDPVKPLKKRPAPDGSDDAKAAPAKEPAPADGDESVKKEPSKPTEYKDPLPK
jgi:hypothetical protein